MKTILIVILLIIAFHTTFINSKELANKLYNLGEYKVTDKNSDLKYSCWQISVITEFQDN